MPRAQRRALITGGSSGLGLAIAHAFAGNGVSVAIAGRDERRLKATGLPYLLFDLGRENEISEAIAAHGPVDIFVANAGGAKTAPALKTTPAVWQEMLQLNLTSVFTCAQASLPHMAERGWGRFIVTASTAALKGYRFASAYVAAKHGVLGLVRALAIEMAPTGVTVNALCPGYADTELISNAVRQRAAVKGISTEEARAHFTKSNPMGRLIAPNEVAAAALWLASDEAGSINGQAIAIDGGETA